MTNHHLRTHTNKETTIPGPLSNAHTVTKLPAQDLERAGAFYCDKLGLEPVEERTGGLRYVCGPTEFHLFSSAGAPSGALLSSSEKGQSSSDKLISHQI